MPDLDEALAFYREVLDLEPHPTETADGAAIASLSFGDSEIELLAPLNRKAPSPSSSRAAGPGSTISATESAIWMPPWLPASAPATV